jgi:repressor LexA
VTRRQLQVLAFIREYVELNGFAPSFTDIMAATGLKSKSGVHRLLSALERLGNVRRWKGRARALELVDTSDAMRIAELQREIADLRNQLAQYQGVAA